MFIINWISIRLGTADNSWSMENFQIVRADICRRSKVGIEPINMEHWMVVAWFWFRAFTTARKEACSFEHASMQAIFTQNAVCFPYSS
jgi:hypothetical protein